MSDGHTLLREGSSPGRVPTWRPWPVLCVKCQGEVTAAVTFLFGWLGRVVRDCLCVCAIRTRSGRGGAVCWGWWAGGYRTSEVCAISSHQLWSRMFLPCAQRSCTGCAHFIFNQTGWVSRWLSGMTVERAAPAHPSPRPVCPPRIVETSDRSDQDPASSMGL